jgi:cell division septation protein DedD
MDFEDYPGRFAQHCHILDHEDHEMMRQFQATHDPANCVVNGVCDPGEDCISCAADCAEVSGALCGNGLCEAGDGENCLNCPADCAGKQNGQNQFCCGADDGQTAGPIACGVDVNDDRCIDSRDNLFCRMAPRVRACCGDALCEGAESLSAACDVDCNPVATPTATPTTTPTPTSTPTTTSTPTATSTSTPTATSTSTPTATSTPTPTATSTATPTATSTATQTATPTATQTSTPTSTTTATPTPEPGLLLQLAAGLLGLVGLNKRRRSANR